MRSPILLDTNLLVLLVVGLTNKKYISKHKRLEVFDVGDFEIVSNLVAISGGLLFTPNVLTETSNLVRYVADPIRSEIAGTLSVITARVGEIYVESVAGYSRPEYLRLGLTDSVILRLCERGGTLVTDDLSLYLAASASGLAAINYNHLREGRSGFR